MTKRMVALLLALVMMLSMTAVTWATEPGTGGEGGTGEGSGEPCTHQWSNWETTGAATCGETGSEKRTCSLCKKEETRELAATGKHTVSHWETTAPTCTVNGSKKGTCSVCNQSVIETIPATGHTWDAGVVTIKATCIAVGKLTKTCKVCTATETEDIPKTDHVFETEGTIEKEATCVEEGLMVYKCTTPGCTEVKKEPIPKLTEHKWDAGTVTTPPTCVKKGVKTYKCTQEGCKETKTEDVAMVNHSWDGGTITIQPTITEKGLSTFKCIVCGKTTTRDIPPRGQSMDPDELATLKAAPNNAYGATLYVEPWVMVQAVLNNEELARVQAGWPFSVILAVKNITEAVSDTDREMFMDFVADHQIVVSYLDITLNKQMEGDPAQPVDITAEMVDIALDLPTGLPALKKNMERTFQVLRIHDGVVEAVPTKYSDDGQQIIFQTDRFSTYALTYSDIRAAGSDGGFPVLPVFIVLLVVALGGAAYVCKLLFIDRIFDDDDDDDDDDDGDGYDGGDDYEEAPRRSGRRLRIPAARPRRRRE